MRFQWLIYISFYLFFFIFILSAFVPFFFLPFRSAEISHYRYPLDIVSVLVQTTLIKQILQ